MTNEKYDKKEKKIEYVTVFSVLTFFSLLILFILRGCGDTKPLEIVKNPLGTTTHHLEASKQKVEETADGVVSEKQKIERVTKLGAEEEAQRIAQLDAQKQEAERVAKLQAEEEAQKEKNANIVKTEASEEAGIINDIQSQSISASPYILKGVYFQTSSSKLSNDKSRRQLDVIANTLKKYPSVKVILRGHTDNKGNDKINKILSEKRALSVKNALIQRGIAPERITAKGMSDTQPIETNDTEEGRALNRRVDIATI